MPEDGSRPRKRQRASQACHRCRSKKFRCDASGPPCGACQTAQASCSYDDATVIRRRGLKPGYVKVLESLWGSVLQAVPGSEDVAIRLLAQLPHPTEQRDDPHQTSPLDTWRTSSLPAAVDELLNGDPIAPASLDSERNNASVNTAWSLPRSLPPNDATIRQHSIHESSVPSSSQLPPLSPSRPQLGSLSLPGLPVDWQFLVKVYLCTEQSWLPLFEKSSLYCWAYSYQDHASTMLADLSSPSRGNFASLWATFVLAELHLNGATSARIGHLERVGKYFLAAAENIEPHFTYSVAFLIWALIYAGRYSLVLARMMLAQATALADTRVMGVALEADRELTLVHHGCFIVDTMLRFATGAQHMVSDEWAISSDFGDVGEWDPFINVLKQGQSPAELSRAPPSRTGSTYLALLKLMILLRSVNRRMGTFEALTREIESWEISLPAHLQRLVSQRAGSSLNAPVPSQSNLQVWYTIVSRMVETSRNHTSSPAMPDGVHDEPDVNTTHVLQTAVRCDGLKMLPSAASILIHTVSEQLSASTTFAASSATQWQLAADFAAHWGWPAPAVQEANRMLAHPQPTGVPLVPTSATQVSAVDPALITSHEPDLNLEAPFSHDLLDYLTMFETDNSNDRNFMEPLGFFPP